MVSCSTIPAIFIFVMCFCNRYGWIYIGLLVLKVLEKLWLCHWKVCEFHLWETYEPWIQITNLSRKCIFKMSVRCPYFPCLNALICWVYSYLSWWLHRSWGGETALLMLGVKLMEYLELRKDFLKDFFRSAFILVSLMRLTWHETFKFTFLSCALYKQAVFWDVPNMKRLTGHVRINKQKIWAMI